MEERGRRQLLQGRGGLAGRLLPPPCTSYRSHWRREGKCCHCSTSPAWGSGQPQAPRCCHLQRGHVNLPLSLLPPRGLNLHRLMPEAWAGPTGREWLASGGYWDWPTWGRLRQLGAAWVRGLDFMPRHRVPRGRRGGGKLGLVSRSWGRGACGCQECCVLCARVVTGSETDCAVPCRWCG